MNLQEKLALLKKAAAKVDKKYEERKKKKAVKKTPLLPDDFLEAQTDAGTTWYRDTVYDLNYRHGGVYMRETLEVPPFVTAFLAQDEEFEDFDYRNTLFIDTETSGLAGGTGTVAFLIGVGFYTKTSFIIRQYFMPDYEHEAAMLRHLGDLMKDYDCLVTFNGRAFDMPLINTRMIMNRLRPSMADALHLDLLFPARRLWKKTIGSCRLTSLERNILRFYRVDDVPGALIPEMYFRYIKDRNFNPLEKVMEHNLLDIITMSSLITKMQVHLELAEGCDLPDSDFYSLGSIYERRGEMKKALEYYGKAVNSPCGGNSAELAGRKLALIHKKEGRWEEAVTIWEAAASRARIDIEAHVELAKYYEHKKKDYTLSLKYSEEALEIVHKKKSLGAWNTFYKEQEELLHRIDRIKRKMKKAEEKKASPKKETE